ncbi:1-deoxyxylulose-5-phosphate synthase YajO-like isoform X2 [Halichondria panicea]|uniref:1-deoxyxylulose-5-phosphate synthase YajO-like isoform X2 n=1 Tax=Halichondria panicea TaxID=6063 RepID=UPI00312B8E5A
MEDPKIPYRYLGNSGLKVSAICLGTMTFGQDGSRPGCDEASSHALLDRFILELGGNFIDTSDVYQFGVSESIIGRWMEKHPSLRSKIILATKVWGPMDKNDVNARGLSRHHIITEVEQSLSRLRTDYIDLYQIHCWDTGTPLEETLGALNTLVQTGKVHYIGVSNVTGWQFQKIIDLSRAMGLTKIVSNQAQYNLLCRSTEWELLEVCKIEGVAMLPWSPLKGGLLTGKYKRGESPSSDSNSRLAWVEKDKATRANQASPSLSDYADNEQYWELIEAMKTIATVHDATVSQVAIAWLLAQPTVSSVVIGARTVEQLDENIGSATLTLSKEEVRPKL